MAALSPDDESNLLSEIAKIEEYDSEKEPDVVGEIENLLDETQKPDPQSCLLAPPPPPSPPLSDVPTPPDDSMLESQGSSLGTAVDPGLTNMSPLNDDPSVRRIMLATPLGDPMCRPTSSPQSQMAPLPLLQSDSTDPADEIDDDGTAVVYMDDELIEEILHRDEVNTPIEEWADSVQAPGQANQQEQKVDVVPLALAENPLSSYDDNNGTVHAPVAQGSSGQLQDIEETETDPSGHDPFASSAADSTAADKYRMAEDTPNLNDPNDNLEPPRYAETSMGIGRNNCFRSWCMDLIEYEWFGALSLSIIICNCITLAAWDPTDPDNDTTRNQILDYCEKCWTAFFFVEMCFKILAMGFIGSGSYLADSWNRLDFVIVVVGLVDFLPLGGGGGFLTSLRPLRVARPLRTINKFPSIRVLVSLIGDVLPSLAAVGLLCFFIFFVFGILAVQLWNGLFHQRCYNTPTTGGEFFGDDPYICTLGTTDEQSQGGIQECAPDTVVYGSEAAAYTTCRADAPNPFAGVIHFDNVFGAWVAIFQCITLEAWVDIMYMVQDGYSFWVFPYFVVLIVSGSWFAVQLMLVVISAQFGATKEAQMVQIEAAKEKERLEIEEEEYRVTRRPPESLIAKFFNLCSKKEVTELMILREQMIVAMEVVEAEMDSIETKLAPAKVRRFKALTEKSKLMREEFANLLKDDEDADVARRTAVFNEINVNADGQVTEEEFNTYVCKFSSISVEDRALVFERIKELDTNGDGVVGLQEFLAGYDIFMEVHQGQCVMYRSKMKKVVLGSTFGNTIMVCICVNVLLMAVEYYGQPQAMEDFLAWANVVFCIIFTIEMLIILTAIGIQEYMEDGFRIFDGIIVIVSNIELFSGGGGGISVLRTFRLVRVFRLISFLPALQRQLGVLLQTVLDVSAFMLLMFLFMYIFAILGMILFGNSYKYENSWARLDRETNRKNFDSFWWALVTVFQTLTQEDWNQGMYTAAESTSGFACVYFITLIVFGNYILLNLFVAIVIDGFAAEATEEISDGDDDEQLDDEELLEKVESDDLKSKSEPESLGRPSTSTKPQTADHDAMGSGNGAELENQISVLPATSDNEFKTHQKTLVNVDMKTAVVHPEPTDDEPIELELDYSDQCCGGWHFDYTFWCMSPENCFRRTMIRTMANPLFEQIIMTTIIINSICIAVERPSIEAGSTERLVLDILGYVFGGIFLVEFVVKVTAMNFYWGPDPYWAQGWNKLDGFLVFVSVIDVTLTVAAVEGGSLLRLLKIFRMLRALRPLRAINKLPGLRAVVETLLASLKPIGSTLIIIATFFLIFGILGTQLFLGKFYFCDGVEEDTTPFTMLVGTTNVTVTEIKTKEDCLGAGLSWINSHYHFDNLGQALQALFVIASIDGWVDIMYAGVDATEIGEQPIRNASPVMAVFFMAFILVGGFLVLNMFVGVILENFQAHQKAEKESFEKNKVIQQAQGTWVEPENSDNSEEDDIEEEPFWVGYPPWRMKLLAHVQSHKFDIFIIIVILLNVGSMAMEHYDMSDAFTLFLEILNYIFTLIFLYEATVKIMALGWARYCGGKDRAWNRFDFFICVISVVGIGMDYIGDVLPINPTLLRVLRVLRVARILKLLKGAEELRKLLSCVKRSLAQAGNLGLLLFLLFFIFACLGTELFGRLTYKEGCTAEYPCEGFSIHANFETFPIAMLTLFRLSTGDNWSGMMKDTMREPPMCSDDETCTSNCCSNGLLSPLFFVFFILIAQFVMLNLVVAVLMKELDKAREEQKAEMAALAAEEAEQKTKDLIQNAGAKVSPAGDDVEDSQVGDYSRPAANRAALGGQYWKRRLSGANPALLQGGERRDSQRNSQRGQSKPGSRRGSNGLRGVPSKQVGRQTGQTGQADWAPSGSGDVKH